MRTLLLKVGYFESQQGGAVNPSTIPAGEIFFEIITEGAVYPPHLQDGKTYGAGWVFCHMPGEQTVWQSPPNSHYECLTLAFNLELAIPKESWPKFFHWGEATNAVSFAHEMLREYHRTDVPSDILGNLIWSQLRLRRYHFRQQAVRNEIPAQILRAMTHIDKFYAQDIGIDELAAEANLSASHLHSKFKESVGMSPHKYLVEQRMKIARHRLVTTAEPIKAISRAVGYANVENFCRMFKRHFKVTAASYRKKYTIN